MATHVTYTTTQLREKIKGVLPDTPREPYNSTSELRERYEANRPPEPKWPEDNGSTNQLRFQRSLKKTGTVGQGLGIAIDYAMGFTDNLSQKINKWTDGWVDMGQLISGPLNKIWRVMLLANRAAWPGEKDKTNGIGKSIVNSLIGGPVEDKFNFHYTNTKPIYKPGSPPNAWRLKSATGAAVNSNNELLYKSSVVDDGDDPATTHGNMDWQGISMQTTAYEGLQQQSPNQPGFNYINIRKRYERPWTKGSSVTTLEESSKTTNDYNSRALEAHQNLSQKITDAKNNRRVVLVNTTNPRDYVSLQTIPRIQSVPTANWVAVNSMGRNDPWAMYTGGEEKITMDLTWYSEAPSFISLENYLAYRWKVVENVLRLVSWSRANGYAQAPPVIKILWSAGSETWSSQGTLFPNDLFVIESANYNYELYNQFVSPQSFGKEFRNRNQDNGVTQSGPKVSRAPNIIDLGLAPSYITQTLVLRRVSTANRTHNDILRVETPLPRFLSLS